MREAMDKRKKKNKGNSQSPEKAGSTRSGGLGRNGILSALNNSARTGILPSILGLSKDNSPKNNRSTRSDAMSSNVPLSKKRGGSSTSSRKNARSARSQGNLSVGRLTAVNPSGHGDGSGGGGKSASRKRSSRSLKKDRSTTIITGRSGMSKSLSKLGKRNSKMNRSMGTQITHRSKMSKKN